MKDGHDGDRVEGPLSDDVSMVVSVGQLLAFVERIERLDEEAKEVAEQRKEVLAEAKGNGFCPKTIKWIVSERKLKPEARSERDGMRDLYLNALGMLPGATWPVQRKPKA